ncbi:PaRep2b protein [Pyrobaculum aerophilum]|uniref:PaRep2b protein n=1 Tax=Pyrobaculum aerophilum TaxID=13773 RepID=UPI002163CF77|nr:PaRep2b protein [Pyrobaculum aerophilum]
MKVLIGKSKSLVITFRPSSAKALDAAIKALKDVGFEEGVHFTAKRQEDGEKGYIRLKSPVGLWRLEELRRQEVDWADKALRRIEEVARGFSDLLEEYLRPAMEAETVDTRGLAAEDGERGMVIREVKAKREGRRPRITVE